MLARREHSEKELQRKLVARDFPQEAVVEVLEQLRQEGLQSDHRFTEAFVHNRIGKGIGPLRISRELQERGIDAAQIEDVLATCDVDWMECIALVREKKFGRAKPEDYREQARQSRFLQYRGFSGEQIRSLFNT